MVIRIFALFVVSFAACFSTHAAAPLDLDSLRDFSIWACKSKLDPPQAAAGDGWRFDAFEDLGSIETRFRRRATYWQGDSYSATAELSAVRGITRAFRVEMTVNDVPSIRVDMDAACGILRARELTRSGQDLWLTELDSQLQPVSEPENLNPAVPDGTDPGGVTIAHIDSGVNYLLPTIAGSLARNEEGASLGFDYWDRDSRPFDSDTGRSPFFPIRHGTAVAHILLQEAPNTRLIPYRYPRPDMSRMQDAVTNAVENGARVIMMPLGSNREDLWDHFQKAIKQAPDTLFIVSAGNDGRNLDDVPIYPAVFDHPNMIVVTSATPFGRLAPGSNWGAQSVDLMVPAENLSTTDHRGATVPASGSSFAVPRVAALAARYLEQDPNLTIAELIAVIRKRAVRPLERGKPKVRWGWIPNPLDDG